ncbi:Ger(x)C family spore germination protein [Lysinibacillus sp. FSL W8-0992]|uniref:Ger(x)C family spore germination protein n=1 Tax=Lysinibacillus sp. FSL W8-0992 TaxID=2954643 RepID=UPI0030F788C4
MAHLKYFAMMVVVMSFLTGCGFKDIDNRVFVTGIGIDPSENEDGTYRVTLKLAIPVSIKSKSNTSSSYQFLVHEGDNIGEIIQILETHTDKVLEFGHAKVILINEILLEENLKNFMDYLFRRGDIQSIAYIGAARDSAEEVLRTLPKGESVVASPLTKFFGETGNDSPYVVSVYLYEIRRDFHSKGIDAILPIVETNKSGTQLIVNKLLVVGDKGKPLELTSKYTQAFNALKNSVPGYSFRLDSEGYKLLINMTTTKMKYNIIQENGQPKSIKVNVEMSGTISQSNKTLLMDKLEDYNKLASREIKQELEKIFTSFQEKDLDPFGFGLRYRTMQLHQKGTIKKWENAYPALPFDVTVDVNLKTTGTID